MGIAIVFVVLMIAICAISLLFIKKYNDKVLVSTSTKELKKEISPKKSKKIILQFFISFQEKWLNHKVCGI